MLRALPLLLLLGLPSVSEAAEVLLHRCKGQVQLRAGCCCQQRPVRPTSAGRTEQASRQGEGCCEELSAAAPARTAAAPAAAASVQVQPHVALLPPAPTQRASVAGEQLPPTWRRTRGQHPAAAPPLYVQHCTYLL